MARTEAFCTGSQFYCYSLGAATPDDEHDIMAFRPIDPKGAGLVTYLQHMAFPEELAGTMRTYLVRHRVTNELVGYFSLKAGLMTQGEVREGDSVKFDTVPGIELANFAVNKAYRDAHETARGCGRAIFDELILECVRRAAAVVGVAVIYLFSLPDEKVIGNYQRYGFRRLAPESEEMLHARLKPRYDARCVFMYAAL